MVMWKVYRYERKRIRVKKFFMSILMVVSISVGSIACYEIYLTNVQIGEAKSSVGDVKKVSAEMEIGQNEDRVNSGDKDISEVVERTLQTVVGISRIKNSGTSIFGTNSVEQLGLGTGTIISENGYILTNEHVSGAKYSNCYITLENGDVYSR